MPDTSSEIHFQARGAMSMEECRTAPPLDFGQRSYATPTYHRYVPEEERQQDHTVRSLKR